MDGGRLTSGGGRLAGVDVADNDDVDMGLLLTLRKFVSISGLVHRRAGTRWMLQSGSYPMAKDFQCRSEVLSEVDGL